jgi:hypothetical protein
VASHVRREMQDGRGTLCTVIVRTDSARQRRWQAMRERIGAEAVGRTKTPQGQRSGAKETFYLERTPFRLTVA